MQNYASLEAQDQEEQGILFHVAETARSRWNHIEDLDSFFSRMYKYHAKHGFLCMSLSEIFEVNQFVFVVVLTTYLVHGINYPVLFNEGTERTQKTNLSEVILPVSQCIENFTTITWFMLIMAMGILCLKCLIRSYQIINFWDIKQFYNSVLDIDDGNLDNLTWHEVQMKIKAVQIEQQMCIHKRELTELDIYHRILRQENYFVALVNKKLLPPRFNVPFLGECVYWTNGLRYNIQGLLFWSPWSPFESPWHLREEYKKQNLRHELAAKLSKQILWLSLINLILAPSILVWQILYTFFNYADILKREPGKIGIRSWSLYGKLYLRHFNELDHELQARLSRAHRPATKYLGAFTSPIVTVLSQHIAFMSGALFSVMIALTIYDEDVIAVENVITIMTALGTITAICRAIIPDETMIWCPESLLQGVVMHTHYLPANWRGRAHTSKIKDEFQQIFQYRFVGLIEDLLSPILTPYFLWKWVHPRSLDIVDFFRNFTVSVVGVGDVCSFAQMDVKKHGNPDWQGGSVYMEGAPDQYTQAEDGKIELSLVHFTTTNPSWVPPIAVQQFMEDVQDHINSQYQDSDDAMYFASYQNFLEMTDGNYHQVQSRFSLGAPRGTQSSLMRQPLTSYTDTDIRTSASMAEGPDLYGPMSMTTSALALHERYYMQTQVRPSETAIETTPLLSPKPPF